MSAYPGPMLKGGFSPLLLPYPKGLEEEGGGAPSTRPELPLSQQEAFYRHLVCLLNLLAHVVRYTPRVVVSFFLSFILVSHLVPYVSSWISLNSQARTISCHVQPIASMYHN